MTSAGLLFLLLLQSGRQTGPELEPGSVAGILRGFDGKPTQCVRVAALPDPQTERDFPAGTTLSSLARTDQEGKFRLDNISPGRYYISAGRVDAPTYYPGTLR